MSSGQMLLVLLAVVLFSTLIITIYNNMSTQMVMATNDVYLSQGIKISDKYFESIETKLLCGDLTLNNVLTTYAGSGVNVQPPLKIGSAEYQVHLRAKPCNAQGDTLTAPFNNALLFCSMNVQVGSKDIKIGRGKTQFKKVLTNIYE